jgi:hypothetical protein
MNMSATPRKTISNGWLYVARVHRDKLTGQVSLTVGRAGPDGGDVFSIQEGDEFITFVTPAALFEDER